MSVSSFDFDKFSLSSDDENDNDYNNVEIVRKNYIYDAELKTEKENELCSYEYSEDKLNKQVEKNKQFKKKRDNNTDVFLNLLDEEKKVFMPETDKSKYMIHIANMDVPKYITSSHTNKPCTNCGVNIEQKINLSFIKILDKEYFLCFSCKDKFLIDINCIINEKFVKLKENNEYSSIASNTEDFLDFEQSIKLQKHNLNKFAYFLEKIMSEDDVKCIVNEIADTAFNNIKFIKPYLNIKIYDFDMGDYRFTNMSRIKSLLKNGSVLKIDNENYKFTKEEFGNHYEYKAKAENKCIRCKTELNLIKFKLAVTKYNVKINHIIKKYENLHYLLYAVCTNCQKICDKIQNDCIKYFIKLDKLNNFNEVIDTQIERNVIIDFLKIYNDKFFQLLSNTNDIS